MSFGIDSIKINNFILNNSCKTIYSNRCSPTILSLSNPSLRTLPVSHASDIIRFSAKNQTPAGQAAGTDPPLGFGLTEKAGPIYTEEGRRSSA
jgi:hypothetical protein